MSHRHGNVLKQSTTTQREQNYHSSVCLLSGVLARCLVAQILLPSSGEQHCYPRILALLPSSPLSVICLPVSLLFVLVLSFSLFVIALSFPLSGDRFWLRQTCKGPDLDTVWHPRISGPRDYPQQGEPPLFPSLSCELSAVCSFKTRHSAFEQTTISTCCTK